MPEQPMTSLFPDKQPEHKLGDGCIRNHDGTYQPMAVGGTNVYPPSAKYVDHAKAIRDYLEKD